MQKKLNTADYERMGRTLETIIESGFMSHRRLFRINFMRGILFGMGSAIGGSLMIGLLAWFLAQFDSLPIIGHFIETINQSINNN